MRIPPALALAACLALPATTNALDLDRILCICADDARTHGDVVACVAQLSRRLVRTGALNPRERAELISELAASRGPADPPIPCDAGGGALDTYGTGLQSDAQEWPRAGVARFEALIWNFTPDDITGWAGSGDGPDCLVDFHIEDESGVVVHWRLVFCPAVIAEPPLASGDQRRLLLDVPLFHENSAVPALDGTPLPAGTYVAVATQMARYPNRASAFDGLTGEARLVFVVQP